MPCRPSTYGKGKWEGDKYKGHGREAIFMDTVLILVLMGISLWANGKIMF